MRVLLLTVLCSALPGTALAELSGRVVAVHDGDSLTLEVQGRKVRVRLDGIDAPEPGQRFGKSATRSLANIFGNSRRRHAMNFGMSCECTR